MFEIDPDIARASGPPAALYCDPAWHALIVERVFARSWQLALDAAALDGRRAVPTTLLPGCLDEPLVFTRDGAALRCLSNVCTHRANLVVQSPGDETTLRCRYHGRCFALDGKMLSMPAFEGVSDFPSTADDLAPRAFARLGPLLFAALDPHFDSQAWLQPVRERLAAFPFDRLVLDEGGVRDYPVAANWALYCDNYLEGFHIPFVHRALNATLDWSRYRTELFPLASLQVGIAADGEEAFDGPERVAGYYLWLFPNLMLNFYPWGLSLNLVVPLSVAATRVHYRAYLLDPSRRGRGAGSALDLVEREDEAVVEAVQRGVRARSFRRARYSPARESGVHHFHRLLARFLA